MITPSPQRTVIASASAVRPMTKEELVMSQIQSSLFLRRVLLADAASCVAMGVLLVAFSGFLGTLLNLPSDLLFEAGVVLLPFAAFVGYVSSRSSIRRGAVWAIIAINVVWVVESFAVLALDQVAPNAFGYAFVIGQALFVAAISVLEFVGLRRSMTAAA